MVLYYPICSNNGEKEMFRANGGLIGQYRPPTIVSASGIWTPIEQINAKRGQIWTSNDPNFDKVSLLMHMDGPNNSTNFIDSSFRNHSFTVTGDAKLTTSLSKFGGSSATFDGSGDYISIGDNSAFGMGTSDYTVEAWIYCKFTNSTTTAPYRLWSIVPTTNNRSELFFGDFSSPYLHKLCFRSYSDVIIFTLTKDNFYNIWRHVALVRYNGAISVYVDGVAATRGASYVSTVASHDLGTLSSLRIGNGHTGTDVFYGNIDELRITKGLARYTSNFTAPTSVFSD
jgi:hypothetical protein